MRALIHVNHLLGTGHAFRAAAIGRALSARGVAVTLATGNTLPQAIDTTGMDVVNLPVARSADFRFSGLVDEAGAPIDDGWKALRSAAFHACWSRCRPDIFLTEHFPFGRRKLAFEMTPVLDAIKRDRPRTLVAASIRDILVRKADPKKERAMTDLAATYYDLVLVHSDPSVVRLEDSFRFTDKVGHLLKYTGFIHAALGTPTHGTDGAGEIIVSVGGGAFGGDLLKTALDAVGLSTAGDRRWRVLAGAEITDADLAALKVEAPANAIIERNRPDFPSLLARAAASISQAGYNTVLDVLAAGIPAVLVPSLVNGNEQVERADILAERERIVCVREADLNPRALASAVDRVLSSEVKHEPLRFDTGDLSAEILVDMAEEKQNG